MPAEAPVAPAAAAAAVPATTPSTPNPSGEAGPQTTKAYQAIDSLFHTEEPAAKPAEKSAKKEPAAKPLAPELETDDGEEGKSALETKAATEAKPNAPKKAASLREAYDSSKAEVAKLRTELDELKKKAAAPAEDPEKKKLMEERDSWSKSKAQYEEELRFADYSRSSEFKEKYQQPFEDLYKDSANLVQSFTYHDSPTTDAEGNAVEGKTRKGTPDDLDRFLSLNPDDANKFAVEHFGHNAQEMILARREMAKLVQSRDKALNDFRTKGAEREKQRRDAAEAQTKEFKGMYDSAMKEALEHPTLKTWLTSAEGDDKAKAILEKGYNIADKAFGDTSSLTTAERARLYGAVRNKAGAFDHVVHIAKLAQAKNAELEQRLKDYEESEPNLDGKGGNKPKGGSAAPTGLASFDAAVDKIAAGG